jgi:aryl-alcohol dehydrogenase-like predicted oxidoreductase
MISTGTGSSGLRLSRLGLGGHEYRPDGGLRGFGDDWALALTPGHVFEGFGQDRRRAVLGAASESGINLFDATQDSEKEALGRNLREMPPPYDVFVQTRPEAMTYDRDPGNRKMADYRQLKPEVERILRLMGRDRIDLLNLGITPDALADPGYLERLKATTDRLREERLIRFASADTFCGEEVYLSMIASGGFQSLFVNLNPGDNASLPRVLPAARAAGMAVIAREAFMKGDLFRFGAEVGIEDSAALARAALRWVLSVPEVTSVVVGAANPAQLRASVAVQGAGLQEDDRDLLERLRAAPGFRDYAEERRRAFREGRPSSR